MGRSRQKGNSGVSVQHEPITPGATFSWVTHGRLITELVNGRMVCYFAAEDGRVVGVYLGVWSCPPVFQWSPK
ncbi:hypothetical protein JMJ78_0000988 [Colletotrichum scovillei]|nr:hypothetical protein JMJ78_0000988 [Colletotrichum scovillei]